MMPPSGGKVIKAARTARGYTQAELAHQYGLSKNTLSNYESGKTEPTFIDVIEILRMLNYSIEEVYPHIEE